MEVTKEDEKKFAILYERYMEKKREEERKELDEVKRRYVENMELLKMGRGLVEEEEEVRLSFWDRVGLFWEELVCFFRGGF